MMGDEEDENEIKENKPENKKKDDKKKEEEEEVLDIIKLNCRECTNTKCGFSSVKQKYCDCEECKEGTMLIHPSKKDSYFAICNNTECSLSYQISSQTKSVRMLKKCESCKKRKILKVIFCL